MNIAREDTAEARILLVDDDATNLRVLVETLRAQNYKLLTAKSGEDALKIIHKHNPELVLLDIVMPGMNGYQVCQAVKQDVRVKDIPILLLSALDDSESKIRGFEAGAVDYVSKPFNSGEVIARVNTHLTVHRLQRRLSVANKRMRRDLDAAARVQRGLLPQSAPDVDMIEFAWQYRPCDELAGDSLGIFRIDERHIGLYVLDVCGHGVSSALLSVAVTRSLTPRTDTTSLVMEADDQGVMRAAGPVQVLEQLNAMYPMDSDSMMYFTIVYAIIDLDRATIRLASAGHPGPVVVGADGTVRAFEATGTPIGIMPDAAFSESELELNTGDRVFLFSDGVYEERNATGELYEMQRLTQHLTSNSRIALDQCVTQVIEDVEAWGGAGKLADDAALLGFEWKGAASPG